MGSAHEIEISVTVEAVYTEFGVRAPEYFGGS